MIDDEIITFGVSETATFSWK